MSILLARVKVEDRPTRLVVFAPHPVPVAICSVVGSIVMINRYIDFEGRVVSSIDRNFSFT